MKPRTALEHRTSARRLAGVEMLLSWPLVTGEGRGGEESADGQRESELTTLPLFVDVFPRRMRALQELGLAANQSGWLARAGYLTAANRRAVSVRAGFGVGREGNKRVCEAQRQGSVGVGTSKNEWPWLDRAHRLPPDVHIPNLLNNARPSTLARIMYLSRMNSTVRYYLFPVG